MHALRQDILPPSGIEFATSLRLTPSTLSQLLPHHAFGSRALCNVVVARTDLLRIFEVREEPAPLPTPADDERDKKSRSRRGTEAVEGEVEMDQQGEGFVNIAKVICFFRVIFGAVALYTSVLNNLFRVNETDNLYTVCRA